MLEQLTLGIRLQDKADFTSFFAGPNQEIICALKELVAENVWKYIYLCGNSDVGKSHLLQASCQYASHHKLFSFYLALTNEYSPTILENLDNSALVCLDNIEAIVGDRLWEEALFHFFNRSVQQRTKLLISGKFLPKQLGLTLPDLVSRLNSGISYQVKSLNDAEKLAALQLRAKLKGFELNEEVGKYILHHCPRNMGSLFNLLEDLDKASLAAQHPLTIPFVKIVLKESISR